MVKIKHPELIKLVFNATFCHICYIHTMYIQNMYIVKKKMYLYEFLSCNVTAGEIKPFLCISWCSSR